jgi:hypothetical protein
VIEDVINSQVTTRSLQIKINQNVVWSRMSLLLFNLLWSS